MTLLDTHVHVWDPARLDYPWLAEVPGLERPFLPSDIDRGGELIDRMIFVQADCRQSQAVDEVRWVAGLAAAWPELVGIVGAADLRANDLDAHLDALCAAGPVVGVRHLLQGQPATVFTDDAFISGLRTLAARDLSFDACVTHDQLPALTHLLRRVPQLRTVLDHLGKPPVREGIDSAQGHSWAQSISEMAALPSLYIKLSGLPAEAGTRAQLEVNGPAFISHAVRAFTPERSMLGSDWPVSVAAGGGAVSIASWIDLVKRATEVEGGDWEAISNVTGGRFYQLDRFAG